MLCMENRAAFEEINPSDCPNDTDSNDSFDNDSNGSNRSDSFSLWEIGKISGFQVGKWMSYFMQRSSP